MAAFQRLQKLLHCWQKKQAYLCLFFRLVTKAFLMSAAGSRWSRAKQVKTSAQRALLAELGYQHDANSGLCRVSNPQLEKFCGVSHHTFLKAINDFIRQGWISKTSVFAGGRLISSYLLVGLENFVRTGEVCTVESADFASANLHRSKFAPVQKCTGIQCKTAQVASAKLHRSI